MKISPKINKFISNIGWQTAAQVYSMFLSVIVGAFTARYLGPSNYGLIGYGQSIVSIFTSIASLGMGGIIVQDIITRPTESGKIIGTATVLRFGSSFICIFVIDLLILVIEPGNMSLRIITLLQSVALVFQTSDVLSFWFQAKLQNKIVSIGSMIAYTLVSAWRVLLLLKGTSVEWFAASSCIQYLTAGTVVLIAFSKKNDQKIGFNLDIAKSLLQRSYHFIFSGIAIALYTQVDKIMLGKLLNEEAVGYYNSASSIANMWEFVPLAIINVARVYIFKAKEKDEKEYYQQLSLLYCGITALSVFVGIVVTALGGIAIRILYGEAFMIARQPLNILIWGTGFAMIGSARGSTWIIAEGLNKYSKHYVFISSATNIVLNALTIPRWGIMGAAVSTLISQIVTAFIAPILFKETRVFVIQYFKGWRIAYDYLIDRIKRKQGENDV